MDAIETTRRPALITVLMVFLLVVPFFWLAWFAMFVVLGWVGTGTYAIGSQPVPRREFLAEIGSPLLFLGVLSWAVSYAFWKERAWGRHLAAAYLVLATLPLFYLAREQADRSLLGLVVPEVLLLWYFYAKANVVRYYGELRDRGPFERS
jgi:hypothetical protein